MAYEKIKWVNEDNFHFTLKFLGETDESLIAIIINSLDNVSLNIQPFKLKIENLGIFGSRYNPRVIWAGIENADDLKSLWIKIQQQLKRIAYYSDRQNFVAHLTFGRIKNLIDKKLFQQIIEKHKSNKFQMVKVDKLILYESVLERTAVAPDITIVSILFSLNC